MGFTILLLTLIAGCISFLILYTKRNYFVQKHQIIASNTTRGFAFLVDFVILNCINLLYRLAKAYYDPVYYEQFAKFAERTFHTGGVGTGTWFINTQLMLICFYIPYSLIGELSPLKSTLIGHYFGLGIKVDSGSYRVKVLIRNLLKPISIVFWPLAMFFSYFNQERKWLHDLLAGTRVELKE